MLRSRMIALPLLWWLITRNFSNQRRSYPSISPLSLMAHLNRSWRCKMRSHPLPIRDSRLFSMWESSGNSTRKVLRHPLPLFCRITYFYRPSLQFLPFSSTLFVIWFQNRLCCPQGDSGMHIFSVFIRSDGTDNRSATTKRASTLRSSAVSSLRTMRLLNLVHPISTWTWLSCQPSKT